MKQKRIKAVSRMMAVLLLALALAAPFQIPDKAYAVTNTLENFESGNAHAMGVYASTGTTLARTISGSSGSYSLQVQYDLGDKGYGKIEKNYGSGQNWSAYTNFAFWFQGSGSKNVFELGVKDNGGELFLYRFVDQTSGWRLITIPFTAFIRAESGHDAGAPNNGFTLTGIEGFFLGNRYKGSGTYKVDQFEVNDTPQTTTAIYVNQRGYAPSDKKIAVLGASVGAAIQSPFSIVNASTGSTVYTGTMAKWNELHNWHGTNSLGDTYVLDFSSVAASGRYKVVSNGETSYSFDIGTSVYDIRAWNPLYWWKLMDTNRSVNWTALDGAAGTKGAGQQDDARQGTATDPHSTGESSMLQQPAAFPAGTRIDTRGGWYDAGDLNKYYGNTAWSVYNLLVAYEDLPHYWSGLDDDSNGRPDLLEATKTALDWLLRMRGKNGSGQYDGSCYERIFNGFGYHFAGRPHQETDHIPGNADDRPLDTDKWSNLCVRGAYAGALGYQMWQSVDSAAANQYLAMAQAAYSWSKANASQVTPAGPQGGYYGGDLKQGLALAALELYKATGTASYLNDVSQFIDEKLPGTDWFSGVPTWGHHPTLVYQRYYPYATASQQSLILAGLEQAYNGRLAQSDANPYRVTFYAGWLKGWGFGESTLGAVSDALWLYDKTGDERYYDNAVDQMAWFWGRNPVNFSFAVSSKVSTQAYYHSRVSGNRPIEGAILPGLADVDHNGIPDFTDSADHYYSEATINQNAQYLRVVSMLNYYSQPNLLQDNFNSYVSESNPPGWTISAAANTEAKVKDVPSGSNKSMRLNDNSASGRVSAKRYFPSISGGHVTVEWKFKEIIAGNWPKFAVTSGNTHAIELFANGSGQLVYRSPSGADTVVQSITSGVWYTVQVNVNTAAQTYDLVVNGQLKASGAPFKNTGRTVDGIWFSTDIAAMDTLYVDDVGVTIR